MSCELCDSDGGELLWRDASCRVVYIDEPGYRGFCRVIWADHVKEMTDLPEHDRAHLMHVVLAVEAVLREALQPHKLNLASLGNATPHLHWHIIPRFRDDPHFPNPIWGAQLREAPLATSPPPVAALRSALSRRLGVPRP